MMPYSDQMREHLDGLVRRATERYRCYAADLWSGCRRTNVCKARLAVGLALRNTVWFQTRGRGRQRRITSFWVVPPDTPLADGYQFLSWPKVATLLDVHHTAFMQAISNGRTVNWRAILPPRPSEDPALHCEHCGCDIVEALKAEGATC